ncbi:ankyrin repeat and IBR domain-containing protein 1-like isoform X3 [Osmerus mordax]|uniref:ankyrin repeat and IBR domain-containing protein 1-like isoform X3 n=1 Tax=Osmerus mordax TaxID=8014 RepID=UPI0035106BC9
MGNTATKFRKALINGDEGLACQLYESNPQFKESLDPNTSYGEPYQHNTPLHYAARHAMTRLLRSFLFSKDGNPNKRNIHNENVLHLLCMGPQILMSEGALQPRLYRPYEDEQRRAECIQIVLKWTGAKLGQGEYESANVNTTDNNKNTCLHYAAASGMKTCVELLVQRQADLFMENENRETPCDCAEKQHHKELALSLESQMVFSLAPEAEGIEAEYAALDHREMYEGLRPQELRRLKDMLIVETADMLQAPLFTAEALLRAHDWDREKLLEAWMSNAEDCCQRSGVQMPNPPPSGYNAWDTLPSPRTPRTTRSSITSPDEISITPGDEDSPLVSPQCGICMSTISIFEEPIDMSCGHEFCRACWEGFLNLKIQEGEAHNIFCPAYDCFQLVPVEVIESVVSREMDKRYLQFDIKAFVDNNPAIRWCPRAGCERAVRLSIQDPGNSSSDPLSFPLLRAPAVDCGKGHLFCWECQGEAHEPCDCEIWRMWLHKVTEMKPEELAGVSEAYEDAANCLWLLSNSKPCANCKSPIQKNEGCNHMQCAKCKYDFCWICLEEWKKHSSSTGGYYRCTRYEVIQQVEEQAKDMTVEEYAEFQYRRRHRQRRRGDMSSLRSNTPEPEDPSDSTLDGQDIGGSRRQGTSMGLSSLDEDDPNILLAIQLSLQESGFAMGEENQEFLVNEASLGAIGTSLPSRLDSTPTSLEVPRASLSSSELLELGDSLARLGTLSSHYAVTSSTTAANAQQHCDNLHNLFTFEPPGMILSSSSNTDSAGHDPAANANLLGNIMAWFHDMNPQSITLVPSSDTDLVQTACSSDQGPLLQILNSKPQEELEEQANQFGHCPHQVPSEEKEAERPTQLDLVDVEALPLALPYIEAELGDDLNISHTDTPKCDSASDLQPSTSSSEWEEQVHLV